MIFYLRGPVPESIRSQLVVKRAGKWVSTLFDTRDTFTGKYDSPDQIADGELVRAKLYHEPTRQFWAYGAFVKRRFYLRPAEADENPVKLARWEDLLAPIKAWEAWKVAEGLDMGLQGILFVEPTAGKPAFHRIWRSLSGGLKYTASKGDLVKDGTSFLHEIAETCKEEALELRSSLGLEDAWSVDETALLLAIDKADRAGALPFHPGDWGWDVSNIWHTDPDSMEVQAERFGYSVKRLKERLERRKAAADRKREEARE